MGAYWHIALPFEVRCLDRPEQTEMVEKMYGEDFRFDHIEREPIELPGLPGGKPFRRERCEKIYRLDANVWKSEFQPFYLAFIEAFRAYAAQCRYRVYSEALDQKLITPFLQQFKGIDVGNDPKNYVEMAQSLEENYFLHYYDLPQCVVYHGYPLPSADASSMKIVTLLHSHEKMNVIPEETVMFYNAVEVINAQLRASFRMAKYLFAAGF